MGSPTLVFFRRIDDSLSDFVRLHLDQQVDCLRRFFSVVVISESCDYAEVCDRYEPDLALFESGVYGRMVDVTNTSARPHVPKLGFLHADAYCVSRTLFIADMERAGVEQYFCISASMGEYTPDLAGRLFVWPNFVDETLYRDYGQPKTVPVLFTGSQSIHYPWRNRVSTVVSAAYPTLTCPHLGWSDRRAAARMVYGERYARLLNAALVVPTCGTIAKDVVRKHFEIPAAASCLVTEQTAALLAAGFEDMRTCVFADESDVVDKLDHLFAHPEELAAITGAGHELVHSRHTAAQRDQIRQWLDLTRGLRPGQRVIQTGPFDPLTVVDESTGLANTHVDNGAVDRVLLRDADALLHQRKPAEAERIYLRCLNYHHMAEPILGLARAALWQGRPAEAVDRLATTIDAALPWPDPVEWAYLIRAKLCQGKPDQAARHAAQFPALRHHELDRIRRVIGAPEPPAGPARHTIHDHPEVAYDVWLNELAGMLRACGQEQPVGAVSRAVPARAAPPRRVRPLHRRIQRRARFELARRRQPQLDAFSRLVDRLARKEEIRSAALVGLAATDGPGRALVSALPANPSGPVLVPDPSAADLVVIAPDGHRPADLGRASIVVVRGINRSAGQRLHHELLADPRYTLVAHDPADGDGYAVFRATRQPVAAAATGVSTDKE
jgi:hypothetical protein